MPITQDRNQHGEHSTPTAMQQLKAATHAHHGRVEGQLDLPTLATSLAQYQRLLRRFYGLYQPLEEQLATLSWHEVTFDFAPRRKCPLLQQDLQTLGDNMDTLHALPTMVALPPITTVAQGFGTLYVLEGSTLGGQLILRHVQRSLGLTGETGGAFFQSYGPAVGMMWKRFGTEVNRHAMIHPTALSEMIEAACATFLCFESWLVTEK